MVYRYATVQLPPRAPPVRRNATARSAASGGRRRQRLARRPPRGGPPPHHVLPRRAPGRANLCAVAAVARDLWRTVPCINADFDEFDVVWYQGDDEDYDDVLAFKRFVNRLLELRDPTAMMGTFWLRYTTRSDGNTYSSEDANGWISHALQKQARVLEFVVFFCLFEPDHSVFTSCYLRRIVFSGIVLCKGFFAQLEAGCPALEDLFLHQCAVHDDEISSHTLKLTIENHLQWCPEFLNVVNLTLGQWCLDANFYALIVFLQNSPRLEKLTLKLEKSIWRKPQRIIGELMERSFTCEHLKTVEVICLENDPQVISVQDFFVSNGMTSVQFHIKHWSPYADDEPAFIRSI